jgi:hypothetical protein
MNAQNSIQDLNLYLRDEILPSFAAACTMNSEEIWKFRNKVHQLRYYLIKADSANSSNSSDSSNSSNSSNSSQAETTQTVLNQIQAILDLAKSLWQLTSDSQASLMELQEYKKARAMNAKSEALVELEEFLSGEDTLKDVLINSVAFSLNWKANTVWVNSAKRAHSSSAKSYLIDLQDQLWSFISDSSKSSLEEMSLQKSVAVGKRLESLVQLISSGQFSTEVQVALSCRIYLVLIQLRLGGLLSVLSVAKV